MYLRPKNLSDYINRAGLVDGVEKQFFLNVLYKLFADLKEKENFFFCMFDVYTIN
jgi:hypothetical protein